MEVVTLRQVLAVLLVFVLLGLAAWKVRRPGAPIRPPWRHRNAAQRSLESVEKLALTPQHVLHVVRVQGREVVLATHPHGCTLLDHPAAHDSAGGAGA